MGWDKPKPKGLPPISAELGKMFDMPKKGARKMYRDQRISSREHRRHERDQTRAYEDIVLAKKRIAQLSLDPFDIQRFYSEDYARHLYEEDPSLSDDPDFRDLQRELSSLLDKDKKDLANMYLGPMNVSQDIQEEKLKAKLDTLTLKKNDELQRKVEELEAKLVEVEKPSWSSLLKEWFMHKVLRIPKKQTLQLGPYR